MIACRYRSVDGQRFIEKAFRGRIYSKEIDSESNNELNRELNSESNYESNSESNHELNYESNSESNRESKRAYSCYTIIRGGKIKDSSTANSQIRKYKYNNKIKIERDVLIPT